LVGDMPANAPQGPSAQFLLTSKRSPAEGLQTALRPFGFA
jgi:hypothetical protein